MIDDDSRSYLLGIDFGTTKTCVTYNPPEDRTKEPDVEIFDPEILSMVSIPYRGKKWLVGRDAREKASDDYQDIDQFKLNIGKPGRAHGSWRSAEIAGRFLSDVRKRFEDEGRRHIQGLTITVPAQWTVEERQATLYATRLANFRCPVSLLEEPLAAFLRHYKEDQTLLERYPHILVFDFGGGTCDISLIQADPESGKPLVVRSDTALVGGGDIDEAIVCFWLQQAGMRWRMLRRSLVEKPTMRFIARDLKERLSSKVSELRTNQQFVDLSAIRENRPYLFARTGQDLDLTITAEELQYLVEGGLEALESPAKGVKDEAQTIDPVFHGSILPIRKALERLLRVDWDIERRSPIEAVILSGGSCRLWIVQDFLDAFFKQHYAGVPISFLPSPKNLETVQQSVGIGAGWHQVAVSQKEQIAIPSLNYPILVTVYRAGKVIHTTEFERGMRLPTRLFDDLKNLRWYISAFAKGRKFEVKIEHAGMKPYVQPLIPSKNISPLGELAWLCSLNEYGLVQFTVRIIDIAQFKRLREPFSIYPQQESFNPDERLLAQLQDDLGISDEGEFDERTW